MDVDKARGHQQPRRIDLLVCLNGDGADLDDLAVDHGDVADKGLPSRAVDDRAAAYDQTGTLSHRETLLGQQSSMSRPCRCHLQASCHLQAQIPPADLHD